MLLLVIHLSDKNINIGHADFQNTCLLIVSVYGYYDRVSVREKLFNQMRTTVMELKLLPKIRDAHPPLHTPLLFSSCT